MIRSLELATADNFDQRLYLLANPDVVGYVRAGGDALTHFERHGRQEGRMQVVNDPQSRSLADALMYGHLFDGISQASPDHARVPVDQFISIGAHCASSFILKELGLKTWSGPFDWIFSSPEMVQHAIRDRFVTFLDRSLHHAVSIADRKILDANLAHHSFYRDQFDIMYVFNHRDPTVEENYRYYARACERLLENISSKERKLMLLIARPSVLNNQQFVDLCVTINEIANNTEILAVRYHEPDTNNNSRLFSLHDSFCIADNRIIDFYSSGPMGSVRFVNEFDHQIINALISQYSVRNRL